MNTFDNEENKSEDTGFNPIDNNFQVENNEIKNSESIGELIKQKRELKMLSLKNISQQTKIHINLLELIEKNELHKLPSKTYVRGFVKSTAKILDINQELALGILENTYLKLENKIPEIKKVLNKNLESNIEKQDKFKKTPINYFLILKILLGSLLVVLLAFNINKIFSFFKFENEQKLPIVLTTNYVKPKNSLKINQMFKEQSEKDKDKDFTSEGPMKVNLIEEKKVNAIPSQVIVNDIKLKNISLGEKQFTYNNSVSKEELEILLPDKFKVATSPNIQNVFINAIDGDSWITFKVDEKEIKKYVLRQGRTVFIRGSEVRIFIGNSRTLKIFYNNKLIDLGVKSGTKNLVFPEELKTKYMSPLFVFEKDGTVKTSDEYLKNNKALPIQNSH